MTRFPLLTLFSVLMAGKAVESMSHNLSCYQCVRYANEECAPNELVPCTPNFDRCVTHIERNERKGYLIKRECGLGPCAFEDDMVNRGLGLDDCDRSKDDFFCVSCCRKSGCNKSSASVQEISITILAAMVIVVMISSHL